MSIQFNCSQPVNRLLDKTTKLVTLVFRVR